MSTPSNWPFLRTIMNTSRKRDCLEKLNSFPVQYGTSCWFGVGPGEDGGVPSVTPPPRTPGPPCRGPGVRGGLSLSHLVHMEGGETR